jgi:hypothetical protein
MKQTVLCILVLASCAGCSRQRPPPAVDPDEARQLLRDVLECWKKGETPEAQRDRSPPVQVADEDWMAGARLTHFEVKDSGDVVGVNLRSRVTLHLKGRGGRILPPRKVVYIVSTNSVVRADSD